MAVKARVGVTVVGILFLASLVGYSTVAAGAPLSEVTLPGTGSALDKVARAPDGARLKATKPRLRKPRWFTPRLRKRVHRAGSRGLALEDAVFLSCPGTGPTLPGVQAGTCEVAPFGCTANFVFYNGPTVTLPGGVKRPAGPTPIGAAGPPFTSDGQHWFIGTAGHCLKGGGVFMQIRTPGVYVPPETGAPSDIGGIAEVGTAGKKMNGGIGKDFGAVQIDEGFLVNPALPIGGPQGIYTNCVPSPVHYFGHGYYAAVAQGKTEGGQAFWPSKSYYDWAGPLLPGDSGSGVLTGPMAAGNLTHGLGIGIKGAPFIPLPVGYGTRMTKILDFLGSSFYLVNQDGTLSRETSACTGPDAVGPVVDLIF